MRMKAGAQATCKCIVLKGLVEHWRGSGSPPSSSSSMMMLQEAGQEAVMEHVSQEIAPLRTLMMGRDDESTLDALGRVRLQLECLRRTAADEKEDAKKKRQADKKAKQEATAERAATKSRRT